MGSAGLARLHGLFAVYKPPGLKWKHLRDTVELQLLKGECLLPECDFALDPSSKIKLCDLVAWAERFPNAFCTLCYASLFHLFRWINKLSIVSCDKQLISNKVGFESKSYLTIAILFATVGFHLSSPSSYCIGPSPRTELTRCPLPVYTQVSMLGGLLPQNSACASCWAPWKAAKRRN